jgi:hypothetical protein
MGGSPQLDDIMALMSIGVSGEKGVSLGKVFALISWCDMSSIMWSGVSRFFV